MCSGECGRGECVYGVSVCMGCVWGEGGECVCVGERGVSVCGG